MGRAKCGISAVSARGEPDMKGGGTRGKILIWSLLSMHLEKLGFGILLIGEGKITASETYHFRKHSKAHNLKSLRADQKISRGGVKRNVLNQIRAPKRPASQTPPFRNQLLHLIASSPKAWRAQNILFGVKCAIK